MRIGVPTEIKNNENRVAITPTGVDALVSHGHEVWVEPGAGLGSRISDDAFVAAGARLAADADDVWEKGDLLLKVKEPIEPEYGRMRADQVLFTYLHLAADRPQTDALVRSGITAIAYETVQLDDGSLPLLAPMSEVAGRLSIAVGAYHLLGPVGGRGTLLGAATGPSNRCSSSSASGWFGTRSPTVGFPAVTLSAIVDPFITTSVSGPGQKASASFPASAGQRFAYRSAISAVATCTIRGFVDGRPFAR